LNYQICALAFFLIKKLRKKDFLHIFDNNFKKLKNHKKFSMKNIFSSVSLVAAALTVGTSCGGGRSSNNEIPRLEFVKDQFGVVTKINPHEPYVFLIFTAHYKESGSFENFGGGEFVLNVLNEHGVKGSFFPTGIVHEQERYQQVFRDIVEQGHYLSGHSFAHLLLHPHHDRSINLFSADEIAEDDVKMQAVLQRLGLTFEQYIWMVPPYETVNQYSADAYRALGYKLANPTQGLITHRDWHAPDHPSYLSAEQLIDNIWEFEREHTLNGTIILIHAIDYPSRAEYDLPYRHLGRIIEGIKELGYGFKTFFDVIELENQIKAMQK